MFCFCLNFCVIIARNALDGPHARYTVFLEHINMLRLRAAIINYNAAALL